MTSKVLDLITIGHALNELSTAYLNGYRWQGVTDEQREFLQWYAANRDEIAKLDSLEALASTDYEKLNDFLAERGFDRMFEPFDGVGVASVLDMLVEWLAKGEATSMTRYDYNSGQVSHYPAFKVPAESVEIYDAAGYADPLVRLLTKTGHSLWLMKSDEPQSGLELNRVGQQLLARTELRPSGHWTVGAVVPMLEIDTKADMDWFTGTEAVSEGKDGFVCTQAFQMFKLRANEKGARVKVATGFGFECTSVRREPYELSEPFVGFFTQPGHDTLPLAAFWADTDSWKNSGGTLEEL